MRKLLCLATSFFVVITALAQDYGNLGSVYPVIESDPVAVFTA
jgi:hypothetical protein